MRGKVLKGFAGIAGLAVVAVIIGGTTVQFRWDRTFDDVPTPEITASDDSAVIARGRYLAYGPAHCAYCHMPRERLEEVEAGEQPPLIGGGEFSGGWGTVYAPNITPDPETGIGDASDGQLARMLRHGVRADGRAAAPIMEFQMLSDEDLHALISFLRAQPAVRNEVPDHDLSFLGKALFAFVFGPMPPPETPPAAAPPPGATIENGRYLVENASQCAACHTARNLQTGEVTGPRLAGGFRMPIPADPSRVVVSPNLTPDPETGAIAGWSEDDFVARFKEMGRTVPESEMPWSAFAQMSENDLRGIYMYLMSLDPIENEIGPPVQPAE